MSSSALSRFSYLGVKAVQAVPAIILHPKQLIRASQGAHWATLNWLDKPWLRALDVRSVIDVGANQGQFAGAALAVFDSAHIFSFEPIPDSFAALISKYSDSDRVSVFPFALGDSDGSVTIHQNEFSESSSILQMSPEHIAAFPWARTQTDIEVPIRRLDTVLTLGDLPRPILLKIDVQGFEDKVLAGAPTTLAACKAVIIETSYAMLYEGEASFSEIHNTMIRLGFQYAGVLDQLDNPQTGRPLQCDSIFLRTDN